MNCIFCQIAEGKVASNILYQDDEVIAFPDIHPQAPIHLLIVSRKHIPSPAHITEAEAPLVGHMLNIANHLAKEKGIFDTGYRLIMNCGEGGGQLVPHLHMHLLGGRHMKDNMG
jgi:histidine triad (HIT) family protein